MEKIDTLLIVDSNNSCIVNNSAKIKEAGISDNIKVALNGGHALLYLNQISHKTICSKTVVLLNMDTPIANGFDFLEGLKYSNSINKENVFVIVIKDNLDEVKIEKTKKFGVNHFISSDFCPHSLKELFNNHYSTSELSSNNDYTEAVVTNNFKMNKKRKNRINIVSK